MAPTFDEVEAALDAVRPYIHSHGGGVFLSDWNPESGVAKVAMMGTCSGCQMSMMTLKMGVEQALLDQLGDAVTAVEAV